MRPLSTLRKTRNGASESVNASRATSRSMSRSSKFSAEKCTTLSGVTYTYELLRRLHFERFRLPLLRSFTQAGGRLDTESVTWFAELAKSWGARFFVMYGQTEATARISCLPPEELPSRLGSVGLPVAEGSIEIQGEDGSALGVGEAGEGVFGFEEFEAGEGGGAA